MANIIPTRSIALCILIGSVLFFNACSCSDEIEENDPEYNLDDPNPCSTTDDCEVEDHVCILEEPGEEGECLPLFEMRPIGEECSQSRHCESGLCYEGECAQPCQDGADCDGDMICGDEQICEEPNPCDSDEDCSGDTACAVSVSGDGELVTICLSDNEEGEAGDACEEHGDCRSRYCLDEVCTAPCEDDTQCGVLQICEEESVSLEGEDGEFDLCTEQPPIDCASPGDCEQDELTCNTTVPESGAVEGAICGLTNPGEEELAGSCTDSAQCESDLCWTSLDGSAGECTVFCEDAGDDCATGQVCTSKSAGLGLCLAACDSNADCDGGNICQLGTTPDADAVHSYCSLDRGDGTTGDSCEESSDCETGICLEVVTYSVTDESCNNDNQCDEDYECRCDPDDPGCDQEVCVSEEGSVESRCSELCANNDDCDGDHDLSACSDAVELSVDGHTADAAACSLEG